MMSSTLRAAARSSRALRPKLSALRTTRFATLTKFHLLLKLSSSPRSFAVSCVRSTESFTLNSLDTFTEEEEMLRESGSYVPIFV